MDTTDVFTTTSTSTGVRSAAGAANSELREGVVYQKNNGLYQVWHNGTLVPCELSSRLRKELVYSSDNPNLQHRRVAAVKSLEHSDPVAVGDLVTFRLRPEGAGLVTAILPRRNRLNRRSASAGKHAFEQVIVANVDLVLAVFAAAQPAPKWNLLDRYLVSAEASELPALIVLTKTDLASDAAGQLDGEIAAELAEYERIGYRALAVSAVTGQGMDALRRELDGRTSVLVGKSGVGKTTLLNALQPGLGRRVGQISRATGKGRHTTVGLEMIPLNSGGAIVDTPGMREFGLWDTGEDELALFFPEMRGAIGRCRFGLDCRHDEEPGCAIRQAVLAGQISPRRYHSYLRLMAEQ
jgi:ribosome biogenesis GTPase